ncbi:MAG: type II toxin-antitoxin system VapC family toxin [Acidobacteriia bacterium]|nr:type II toxin-antitoxin system VapC family toxin [Terriglobia bacterium]
MALILDTNALSAVVDGDPAIRPLVRRAASVEISAITLGEYRFGISQSKRRSACERWLHEYLELYTILAVTDETAQHYAVLRAALKRSGNPIPANELWIAAHCRQFDLAILSRDEHFDCVPSIRRIGW